MMERLRCTILSPLLFFGLTFLSFSVLPIHSYLYKEKFLNVPVDHFSFLDNRTFALRYCVNDSFWEPNYGPVFFYTGNEGPIEAFIQNTGFLWESAARFRALVVFAEHRFYGKSMPFGRFSYSDPRYYSYLTTQQALADFVDVVYYLREDKKNNPIYRGHNIPNPVIAFGGSYGGMLAAWIRMKYPAVFEGSLASSAPIWGFSGMIPSCDAFSKKVTSIFADVNKLCPKNIRLFWDELLHVTETREGRMWLSRIWKLCRPLNSKDDVSTFRLVLEDMFAAVSMVNYPYSTTFLNPLPPNPVKVMCSYLSSYDLTGIRLVERMSKVASVYFNYTGMVPCFNWTGGAWGDIDSHGWDIQSCLDMVMPYCMNGQTDMFLQRNWTFPGFAKDCYSSYRLHPDQNIAEKLYGGKDISAASNIIFSNGELDPCITGGVVKYKPSKSSSIEIVVLKEAAHHLDLRATHVFDPSSVTRARKLYEKIFKQWIKAYYKRFNVMGYDFL